MWRTLKRNEEIHLVLNEDQAEVLDYLIQRMSLTSDITLSSPTFVGFQLFAQFFSNLGKIYKLWFKYRNLAQLDELKLLHKELRIEPSEGEGGRVFLLK